MTEIECSYLLSQNRTLFDLDVGWEGIPFNIMSNSFIAAVIQISENYL